MHMKNILYILATSLILPALLLTSCGNEEAARKAQEDSIRQAKAQAERLKAQKDSLEQVERKAAERRAAELAEQERKSRLKFHVILGGFVYQNNADNFAALQLQSYPDAKIFIAPNGFKLVSIGDFETMQEAIALITRIHGQQSEPEPMWVYEEGGRYDTSSWLSERGDIEEPYDPSEEAY